MIVPFSHVRNIFTPEWSSCLKIIKKNFLEKWTMKCSFYIVQIPYKLFTFDALAFFESKTKQLLI